MAMAVGGEAFEVAIEIAGLDVHFFEAALGLKILLRHVAQVALHLGRAAALQVGVSGQLSGQQGAQQRAFGAARVQRHTGAEQQHAIAAPDAVGERADELAVGVRCRCRDDLIAHGILRLHHAIALQPQTHPCERRAAKWREAP